MKSRIYLSIEFQSLARRSVAYLRRKLSSISTPTLGGFLILVLISSNVAQNSGEPTECSSSRQISSALLETPTTSSFTSLQFKTGAELELKIASRKVKYRVNDLISLDLALLNLSSEPLYALRPQNETVELSMHDSQGGKILTGRYEVNQLGYSTRLFSFLVPRNYSVGTINVLLGCEIPSIYMKQFNEKKNTLVSNPDYGRLLVAEGMFVSFGDFCADVKRPGSYSIKAELMASSRVVHFPNCKDGTRTLNAEIESKPFTIEVIN